VGLLVEPTGDVIEQSLSGPFLSSLEGVLRDLERLDRKSVV
jgi:hypothetical protein